MNDFIYVPPPTSTIKIEIKIPFLGKAFKINEISINDYKKLFRDEFKNKCPECGAKCDE